MSWLKNICAAFTALSNATLSDDHSINRSGLDDRFKVHHDEASNAVWVKFPDNDKKYTLPELQKITQGLIGLPEGLNTQDAADALEFLQNHSTATASPDGPKPPQN